MLNGSLGSMLGVMFPTGFSSANGAFFLGILGAGTALNDPGNLSLAPRGTPLYNITYGNVAPRLGVAYLPAIH